MIVGIDHRGAGASPVSARVPGWVVEVVTVTSGCVGDPEGQTPPPRGFPQIPFIRGLPLGVQATRKPRRPPALRRLGPRSAVRSFDLFSFDWISYL